MLFCNTPSQANDFLRNCVGKTFALNSKLCVVFFPLSLFLHNLITSPYCSSWRCSWRLCMLVSVVFQDDLSLLLDSPDSLSVPVSPSVGFVSHRLSLVMSKLLMCSVLFCCVSQSRGTIKDKAGFNAGEDASALRKAMEGIGERTRFRKPPFFFFFLCLQSLPEYIYLTAVWS